MGAPILVQIENETDPYEIAAKEVCCMPPVLRTILANTRTDNLWSWGRATASRTKDPLVGASLPAWW